MKKLLFMLLLCQSCIVAYGQDVNNELLKKLVEKEILTQSEADEIEKESASKKSETADNTTIAKVRKAFNTPYMQFGGYGLFLYEYSDVKSIHNTANPRVIFLTMQGQVIKNVKYFAMAEFVHPMVYEFYGEWTPSSSFNLKLGQMKTPLSIENQISLTQLEYVVNTRTISSLVGMAEDVQRLQNGTNNTGRDVGLMTYGNLVNTGTHNLIEYNIGVFQGTGLNTPETDNTKDFAVNTMFQPVKGFRIGGGAYFGNTYYSLDESVEPKSDHVHNRWAISADYKTDRFTARAEFIRANDGGIKKEGIYGTALYYVMPKKVNVFGKVDHFNKDKSVNIDVTDYTAGVNYYFYPSCRLQFNYTYSDYSAKWGSPNSNVVYAQMQFVF